MITSGFTSAIQRFEKSKPLKTGAQYGVCVLPRSMAAPIAGTCEQFTLATILATAVLRPGGLGLLRFAAVAFDGAPAVQHHLRVLLLGGSGHERGDMLKRQPVGGEELGQKIDVTAELDHPAPVASENRLALLGSHRKFLQVGRLVRFELLAVVGLHERHAEHVDVISLTRALCIEERRARNVLEWVLRFSHLTPQASKPYRRCGLSTRILRCNAGS